MLGGSTGMETGFAHMNKSASHLFCGLTVELTLNGGSVCVFRVSLY